MALEEMLAAFVARDLVFGTSEGTGAPLTPQVAASTTTTMIPVSAPIAPPLPAFFTEAVVPLPTADALAPQGERQHFVSIDEDVAGKFCGLEADQQLTEAQRFEQEEANRALELGISTMASRASKTPTVADLILFLGGFRRAVETSAGRITAAEHNIEVLGAHSGATAAGVNALARDVGSTNGRVAELRSRFEGHVSHNMHEVMELRDQLGTLGRLRGV